MKQTFVIIALASVIALPASAQAMTAKDIKRCNAMAATIVPKKAEIETLQAKRDALAEKVEANGEVWEEAEVHRNMSPALSDKADSAKTAYQTSKASLVHSEAALQGALKQFNIDVSDYNRSCAAGSKNTN